ncbi:MAG: type VI secretion system tube protein TssD [Flavihumibacter sp.]
MSFKAKLNVAGKDVNVLQCHYQLKQETDATGRPSSIARGGKITLTVESTGDTTFFEWMCNNFERKDGTITFVKRDTDAKLKELNFAEAYLVEYKENFDSTGETPVTETFTISAREIKMGSGSHINEWVKN